MTGKNEKKRSKKDQTGSIFGGQRSPNQVKKRKNPIEQGAREPKGQRRDAGKKDIS